MTEKKIDPRLLKGIIVLGGIAGVIGAVAFLKNRKRKKDGYDAMSEDTIPIDWDHLAHIDRADLLEDAGIDNEGRQKRLAGMKWHRLIGRELSKAEHDRLIQSMDDYWAWKFESAGEGKYEPITL